MWRAPLRLLRPIAAGRTAVRPAPSLFSGLAPSPDRTADVSPGDISNAEAKKLLRLVNVEALRRKLASEGREVIGYSELIRACEVMGVARSADEASAFAKALDDAGVVLLLRDKVYLHPNRVVETIRKAVPSVIEAESDTRLEEWRKLKAQKEKIDMLAHKQVRRILWTGLGVFVVQMGLFFRLTFWEFSWDVMEPIAFFTTSTGLIIGYAYFLITSRDPTYQDFMKRLFNSRQKKLCEKEKFDMDHYLKLQNHCHCSLLDDIGAPHEVESIYKG